MSEEDVQVVRDIFAASNERDWERAMSHYADDVTLVVAGGVTPGAYRGKVALGEWFGDWLRNFASDYHFEIREVRELQDGLIYMRARHRGRGRRSGVEVETVSDYLYRVRGGEVTRAGVFFAPNDPLDPETLREWLGAETD